MRRVLILMIVAAQPPARRRPGGGDVDSGSTAPYVIEGWRQVILHVCRSSRWLALLTRWLSWIPEAWIGNLLVGNLVVL